MCINLSMRICLNQSARVCFPDVLLSLDASFGAVADVDFEINVVEMQFQSSRFKNKNEKKRIINELS